VGSLKTLPISATTERPDSQGYPPIRLGADRSYLAVRPFGALIGVWLRERGACDARKIDK
jgi:hypothetical protein